MTEAEQWVSVAQASEIIGKSQRSVRRWIKSGQLRSRETPSGLQVEVSEYAQAEEPKTPGGATERLAALEAENTLLKRENERLWQALAMAMQNEQRLIEAQTPGTAPGDAPAKEGERPRPWWRFWER